eukprot:symbB.v1.2.030851.t1/scaffold3518.1/size54960/2
MHLDIASLVLDLTLSDFLMFLRDIAYTGLAVLLLGTVCTEPFVFLLDSATFDSTPALRSFSHLESSCSVRDLGCLGFFLPLQSASCLDVSISTLGTTWISSFLVFDVATVDFSMFLRSPAYLDTVALTLDTAHAGVFSSLRAFGRLEFSSMVFGFARFDAQLFVVGVTNMDLSMFVRSFARLDFSTFVMDFTTPDASLLLHRFAHMEATLSIFGSSVVDFLIFVLDYATLEFLLLPHGFSHLASSPFIFDTSHFESTSSLQSFFHLDFLISICNFSRFDVFPSLLAYLHLDLLVFSHSSAHTELSSSFFDAVRLASSLSARSFVRFGFSVLSYGAVNLDTGIQNTLSICNAVYFDLSMLLQSFARSDLATFVHDVAYMDLLLLLRNVARLDVPSAILNACRIDVFLMVLGAVKLGSVPFLQSFAYVDSALLVSSHMDLDFSLFLQGLICVDFLFFLSIISSSMVGSFLPSQFFAHSDFDQLVLDHTSLDPSIFPRKSTHLDFSIIIFGTSRVEFPLFILAAGYLDVFTSLQSVLYPEFSISLVAARLGSSTVVLDFTTLDVSLSLHSLCHLDFSSFLCGVASFGFVYSMSVLYSTTFDSFILLHSFGHLEFLLLILDMVNLEVFLLPHNFAYLDLSFLVLGAGCMAHTLHLSSSLFVLSSSLLGSFLLLHSLARLDLLSLMLSNLQMEVPISLQSSSYLDVFMSLPSGFVSYGLLRVFAFLFAYWPCTCNMRCCFLGLQFVIARFSTFRVLAFSVSLCKFRRLQCGLHGFLRALPVFTELCTFGFGLVHGKPGKDGFLHFFEKLRVRGLCCFRAGHASIRRYTFGAGCM